MRIRQIVAASVLGLGGAFAATQAIAQAYLGGSIGQSDIDDEVAAGATLLSVGVLWRF